MAAPRALMMMPSVTNSKYSFPITSTAITGLPDNVLVSSPRVLKMKNRNWWCYQSFNSGDQFDIVLKMKNRNLFSIYSSNCLMWSILQRQLSNFTVTLKSLFGFCYYSFIVIRFV
jgi:hypothetical protein